MGACRWYAKQRVRAPRKTSRAVSRLVANADWAEPTLLTAPDPEQSGEGGLDPLGLASLADRLADTIAPGVTARMTRIRFVTAIAIGAVATESMREAVAADGVSPAYLAFEWLLVEALARDGFFSTTGDDEGARHR